MWRPRSDVLSIGLSAGSVAWQTPGGAQHHRDLPAQWQTEELAASIKTAREAKSPSAVHLVVGSSLARHWLQVAPVGLRSLAELQELTNSRAEQLFGGASGWIVAADWHPSRPFLCAAMPRGLEKLGDLVAEGRRIASSMTTSLVAALARLHRQCPREGWWVLYEPRCLHLLHLSQGVLDHLRSVVVADGLMPVDLDATADVEVKRAAAMVGGVPAGPVKLQALVTMDDTTQSAMALSLALGAKREMDP